MTDVKIKRALLSVSDKAGLIDLGRALARHGVDLVSTGGTAKSLRDAGLDVRDISDLTGFPEMMDGRVKTLHPKVHGGLLAVRDNAEHVAAMQAHDIGAIDLVVVNLYPFAQTVAKGASRDEIIENIDIGGPSMVRSAAKNHEFVAIVTDPADYAELIAALDEKGGATDYAFRRRLAAKAYSATAAYDAMISQWFAFADLGQSFPDMLAVTAKRKEELRYGENPHQQAALYIPNGPHVHGIAQAEQLQGKELSYNNYNDADAALELLSEFRGGPPTVVIVKHANPCGLAVAENIETAYERALACDPISAFGGVVALNQLVNLSVAEQVIEIFTEVVIAPAFMPDALELLQTKKNLRIIVAEQPTGGQLHMRSIDGGLLVQESDVVETPVDSWRVVSVATPTKAQLADAAVAWIACASVSSNAITLVRDGQTVGIGGGQQNRVDATRLACERAGERAHGAVAASDAFFPFRDGPDMLARHGVAVVVQPGGSQRDEESIASANEHGIVMIFTDIRHFKH